MRSLLQALILAPLLLPLGSCGLAPSSSAGGTVDQHGLASFDAREEVTEDFASWLVPAGMVPPVQSAPVRLERITTAVPWPRGLVVRGDELIVLARGRHRNAGGIDPRIEDFSGSLLAVDPEIAEPVVHGREAGEAVKRNARVFAGPSGPPFLLYDRSRGRRWTTT